MFFEPNMSASPEASRQRELQKALTVGYPAPGTAPGSGAAYAREDLSNLLVPLTNDMADLKLFPQLFKQPVKNPVYQYDLIRSWGQTSAESRFMAEIARPLPDSAVVERVNETVCYMGILGQVSDPAMLTDMIVDPEVQEVRTQTMQLLRSVEQLCYTGDKTLNKLGFDGFRTRIIKQSPAYNIIDLHGQPLSLDALDQALSIVRDAPNYGRPSEIHLNIKTLARFNRDYIPQARFDATANLGGARGFNIEFDRFRSVVADVDMVGTTFIDTGSRGLINPAQDGSKTPSNPTVSSPQSISPGSGQTSNFIASDAGQYFYAVQACNSFGSSQMVQLGLAATNVAAGEIVNITITAGSGPSPDYFIVFRTPINGSPDSSTAGFMEIGRVANVVTSSGAVPILFVDSNSKMPGTTEGYVFDFRLETMFWIQMLALAKQDLARFQTAKEFMINMYGAPALRAPGRVALFQNIGS